MKRVVVADTNVLISAIQEESRSSLLTWLLTVTSTSRFPRPSLKKPCAFWDKLPRTSDELGETKQLRVVGRIVTPTERIRIIVADPSDDRILERAVAVDADVIVSGDNHLLALGSFKEIPIQRVSDFLAAFQERQGLGP